MVYPGEGFDPLATLKTVEAERCTALYGVPTMFIAELEHPEFERFDLSSLRTGIMAGAPCPIAVMRKAIDRMHMSEVTIAYGMTETSPVSFQSSTDDSIERRVSTIGRVHPHVEVKIVDKDGRIVTRGERGELCTRGYSVMLGYWDEEEKTREAIDAAGWMHTGDLATIDAEGYGNIVGRIKDMVIRGGENLYPRESRGISVQTPEDPGRAGVRRRRPPLRRGALRLGARARRRDADGGRGARVLRGPDRPQQDPALRRIRRGIPDDRHRQGAKISDAQGGRGEAWAEGEATA